jgi:hypothetical protein
VLAPLVAVLAGRSFTGTRRRARRAAWATALLVAVAAAFVPLVWLITAVAMLAGAVVFQRRRGAGAVNAAIVIGVPLLLLMPWTASLLRHPAQLFLEAGMTKPGLSSPHLAARSLLLLSPGGPGLPAFWVTSGLALAAAIALLASGRRALVLAGWGLALTGLVTAAAVSRVAVTPPDAPAPVPAWPGAALAIAGAGLLLAVVAAADRMPARLRQGGWRTPRGLAVLAVAVVACSAPVLAAAHWVVTGVNGPVAPAAGPVLPEFVAVSSDGGSRLRTLVIQAGPHGSVTYTVLRDSDPLLGAGELAMPVAGERALDHTVAALTAPDGADVQDQGQALAGFGVGYVLLPAPVNENLARLLDGVPGLRPVSNTSAFQLWRVVNTTARVTVTQPDGTVAALRSGTIGVIGAKAPDTGGTLVLAEPAGGWHATLNGHPLTPLKSPVNGWAQGFQLPAGGGSLSIGRSDLARTVAVAAEALAVLVVIGLGLPGAKEAEQTAEETAGGRERSRRAGGHGRGGDRRAPRRGRAAPADVPADAELEPAAVGVAAGPAEAEAAAPGTTLRGAVSAAEPAAQARGTRRPPVPSQARSRLRNAVPSGVRAGLLRRGGAAGEGDRRGEDDSYPPGRYARPGDSDGGDEDRYTGPGGREYQGARRAHPDDATAYMAGEPRRGGRVPGRRRQRGYDPGEGRERPAADPGTGPQRYPEAGHPGYGEGRGFGPPGPGGADPAAPGDRDPYGAPAGRRRRGGYPPAPGPVRDYDTGPGGGYGAPPGGARGSGPGPRGRDYDTGGGRGYDTGPQRRGRGDYDTGPREAATGYDTGPRPAAGYDTGYDTGPPGRDYDTGGGRRYGPGGGRRGRDYDQGDYDRGGYGPGDSGRGSARGDHDSSGYDRSGYDLGGYDTGPGGPDRGYGGAIGGRRRGSGGPPGGGEAPSRGGRRRGWLGRGAAPGPDERPHRRAPYPPPRSQDGALSPLPPLPPRSSRRQRFDDDYEPAEGPPADWGQDRPDEGDPDW